MLICWLATLTNWSSRKFFTLREGKRERQQEKESAGAKCEKRSRKGARPGNVVKNKVGHGKENKAVVVGTL